jgi:TIR domain
VFGVDGVLITHFAERAGLPLRRVRLATSLQRPRYAASYPHSVPGQRDATRVKVFISYSRHDEPAVSSLVDDLKRARMQVWLDNDLRGGDAWWMQILDEIRQCSVFVFAASDKSLDSEPCLAERDYAKGLGLPSARTQSLPNSTSTTASGPQTG